MDDDEPIARATPHAYLAAPWRMRYLSKNTPRADCVFCNKLSSPDDVDNLVLWRFQSFAVVMNLYPYATGHVMLIPFEHLASPEELADPALMSAMAAEIPATMRALRRVLSCQGFNTGMNTGGAAGAGIADHMHMHIVPRWTGDANFMPVIGKTTVMPEELSITYAKLRAELIAEHDHSSPVHALVRAPDRSSVFLLADDSLPSVFSDGTHSIVSLMASSLESHHIDASIAGWVGDDTVVWQAHADPAPEDGRWTLISELPEPLRNLVNQSTPHLEHR